MNAAPKDPDAPPPFRLTDNEWGMTVGPLALSPVRRPEIPWDSYDRNNPSHFLKNHEWGELWEKMTERAIARIIENQKYIPQKPEQKKKYQHMQGMVVALLGGKEDWEYWQTLNPAIKNYDFQYFDFFHEINLHGITFDKNVSFLEATFAKEVNFEKVAFNKAAYFLGATFTNNVSFLLTRFASATNFLQAIFIRDAYFPYATFDQDVIFNSVKFAESAVFTHATFAKLAYFSKTKFAEMPDFDHTKFQSFGYFNDAKFYGNQMDFNKVILSADSNLIFTGARFENAVPDFCHLKSVPNIRFHNFDVVKPSLSPSKKKVKKKQRKLLKKKFSLPRKERQDAIFKLKGYRCREYEHANEDRYRKLKELAIDGNDHEYELIFYGYEMDSKLINFYKEKEKRFSNKKQWMSIVPTLLYKISSNYGQSILFPLVWLVVLLGVYYLCKLDFNWWAIFKTISPLPLSANEIGEGKAIGKVGLAIKIFATIFWFLFLLGVRNKFKIK